MDYRSDPLFSREDLFAVLEHAKAKVAYKIDTEDAEYVLKVSEQDYIAHVVGLFQMQVPVLLEDQIEAETPTEVKIDMSNRFEYGWAPNIYVSGSETAIVVPFEGDAQFFGMRPSTYSSNPPRASVSANELRFTFTQLKADGEAIKRDLEQQLKITRDSLQSLRSSVNQFHALLPGLVTEKVKQRKQKLLESRGMAESLGFPVRRREGTADTYKVPVARKKVVTAPKVPTGNFKPEPVLENATYEEILSVIENMTRVMELSPGAFIKMGEEDLRTHFLVQLNGQFQGQATGETFNYEGKTDILMRAEGKNIFIAECKFWEGEGKFLKTISQLMEYLSWHDTKCAVMMFNRNVNFSAVLNAIAETVPQHPNFKRDQGKRSQTSHRYVFGHPEDKNRELIVTVMAFNIPTKTAKVERQGGS